MKETMITIVIGALGMISKGLVKRLKDLEIRGQVETIQTTDLLKLVKIMRRILGTRGDLLSHQIPVKNHKVTLVWKTLKGVK